MKKALKIFGYITLALILLSCLGLGALYLYPKYKQRGAVDFSEWKTTYMNEIPVEPADFKEDFESIFKKVIQRYAYIERKHLNMDSLHEAFASRLDTVQTKPAYAKLLREFFADLHAGHADIAFKSRGLGLDIAVIENRVFIDHPRKQLENAGMQQGDEILTVDGVPVQQWIKSNEKYISASTDAFRYLRSAWEVMLSYTDSVRRYTIQRNGQPLELTMKLHRSDKIEDPVRNKALEWEEINEDFGYLAVNEMSNQVLDSLGQAIQQLRHLPNLIVDVRRNGGGNSTVGDSLTSYLIKGEQKGWNSSLLQPRKNGYPGKVYILMSTHSFSAAESFIITMKESGDAVLVGEPSGGDTGGLPLIFKSEHGIYFRIPALDNMIMLGGYPLEGKAIQPDHLVPQKVSDFLEGRDTQLEYILTGMEL